MASTATTFDTDCKVMLHMDGADTSTTFTDSSDTANTFTAVGNAQIDTAQFKFGQSGVSDGTGDKINCPDNAVFDASGDFTVDGWFRFNGTPATSVFWEIGSYGGANGAGAIYSAGGLRLDSYCNANPFGGNAAQRAWTPSANTWYHLAWIRTGTTIRAFIDGTQLGVDVTEAGAITPSDKISLFDSNANDACFNGWIDEWRYVVGTAVWTTNFTPPTSAYTKAGGAVNFNEINTFCMVA